MGNVLRIVAGVAGLALSGRAAVRAVRARRRARDGEPPGAEKPSFVPAVVILAATAVIMVLTVPLG